MKVLISTSSFGKADSKPLEVCKEKCEVIVNPYGRKLTTEEFIELTAEADAVIAGVENITREALVKRPNIKVISRCGVGMDNVDQEACKELGIKLYNTPNAPVASVAELTVTVMLDLLKNVSNMNRDLKAGNWNKMTGYMLKGKRIGIIGMGRIGRRVAELLHVFGVETAYTDIQDMKNGYTYMEKQALLLWADIITIHASNCKEGTFLLGAEDIQTMKETSFLVNTSRGRFVDEDALYNALKTKRIQGAALDVYIEEPYQGRLCELDNVLLTPHISSSAKEGRAVMEMEAVQNLFEGLGINHD
jgi:D-3-phosphoglycerate dehydrogenase